MPPTDRELMQQPQRTHWEGCEEVHPECRKPEQEPVAWVCEGSTSDEKHAIDYWPGDVDDIPVGTMLYTAPPQRKPLTDEEISDLWCKVSNTDFVTADTHVFARAIEAAHGIKGDA